MAVLGVAAVTASSGLPPGNPWAVLCWSACLLLACAGWGRLVERVLTGGNRADLGLQSAWGLGALVATGGWLCVGRAVSPGTAFLLVNGGVLALAATLALDRRREVARLHWATRAVTLRPLVTAGVLVALLLAAFQFVGAVADWSFNVNDDYVAYFPFARKMLQTGTLDEPFSLRRLSTLGGQSFLHALLLPVANEYQLHVLDRGVCLLLMALLVVGALGRGSATAVLVALWLVVLLPNNRVNTTSHMSGAVLFLALFRTLQWLGRVKVSSVGAGVLLGMLAAAVCTFRQNFMLVAALLVGAGLASRIADAPRGRRSAAFRTVLSTAVCGLVFLVPWMIASHRSSGTFLFPVFPGNFSQQFSFSATSESWQSRARFLWDNLTHPHPFRAAPLFLVAGLLLRPWRSHRALVSLVVAVVLGWVSLVLAFPTSDPPNLSRYSYAFLLAAAVAVVLEGLSSAGRLGGVVTTVAAGIQLLASTPAALEQARKDAHHVGPVYFGDAPLLPAFMLRAVSYEGLQASVPEGGALLVMLDFPFLLDFTRNPIVNIDTPGAVAPPPGLPVSDGGERVADYLTTVGIPYVAFVRPERAVHMYRRDLWEGLRDDPSPLTRAQVRMYLGTMDALAELSRSRVRLHDDGTLVVLDLTRRVEDR
ncbi:MAG: hypothetical protein AB2A00_05565 [Myxococcota bacterium]